MGDSKKRALRVGFDGTLRLEFHGAKITSDAGLLLYRELDEALGLFDQSDGLLVEMRTGKNIQHGLTALLRQSVYSRLAGYEDVNDAERLRVDPAMRHVVGGRAKERLAASTSEMSRFETDLLAQDENLQALTDLGGLWIDRVALAYNVANSLRTLALPRKVEHWSLTTLREKVVKIGANVPTSSSTPSILLFSWRRWRFPKPCL